MNLFNTIEHGDGRVDYVSDFGKSKQVIAAEHWIKDNPSIFAEIAEKALHKMRNGECWISVRGLVYDMREKYKIHIPNAITPCLADILISKFPQLDGLIRRSKRHA